MNSDLKRLMEFDEIIQNIVREFGLDFFPQEFDTIPAQKMLEILAYRFPVNFSHWSFGRDYELERTKYEHGFGIPYEVVLNSNPSRAYLMNTNPLTVQVMVMAHVYAHNDFMKHNRHFGPTRRDILPAASEAAIRFQEYEKRFGLERVEWLIDAGLSIETNVDPDFFIREESEEEQRERLEQPNQPLEQSGQFDDLFAKPTITAKERDDKQTKLLQKTPLEPERDVMLYVQNHSPKPLRDWEKDVLSVIRDQSQYFMPQRRTKIMNEGWASLWHARIMDRLFKERLLKEEEHGYYNLYNARVLASNPRVINPYLVGLKMFENIEDRWNKGRFGPAWERAEPRDRENWDLNLGQGRDKIFEVRRTYSDRFFIEHFLTEQLVKDLELYLYEGRKQPGEINYAITELDWRVIRDALVSHLSTFGIPVIMVEDGDYQGKRELYLKHAYEGTELDLEYRKRTMEHVFYLWDRTVYLESADEEGGKVVFAFDGKSHSEHR
ncbi:MAG: SpoVR family protein [bacterium]|nr:SpoVR family protein [bacterium]